MSSFEQRIHLTEIVEGAMNALFPNDNCIVQNFGCDRILGDNVELWDFIREPIVNQQASAMIVKFAPDFLLLRKSEPKELFFIDVKHSVAPTWAPSRLEMLREKNNDPSLTTDRIGVIAREALLSYRRYYPNTIVLMACPYNSKLLMAQFAKDIRCLYCYRAPGKEDYDCANCPAKTGGFFDIERATKSDGSQTPMTNVDLDSFLPADEFFKKLGIQLDSNALNNLLQEIKKESIEIGDSVKAKYRNTALFNINQSGCDWVDCEVYASSENSFYHLDKDCQFLRSNVGRIETYATLGQALQAGKKVYCRKCCPSPKSDN